MKHYIVGDVHGEYKALLNLVAKIPKNSQLIFVGDLIDRGSQSAQVVRFVREHKLPCVRGNHEEMMIEHGGAFIRSIEQNESIEETNMWLKHGGIETLLSYGLVSLQGEKVIPHPFIKEFIFQFKDDIEWMKSLPIYLELDAVHSSGRAVVVSHSSIAPVWHMRNETQQRKVFVSTALWSRTIPLDKQPIFNIFGHTPQQFTVKEKQHYVNVDTGCYMKEKTGYGLLSAYCVESGEVYSSGELSIFDEKIS